MAIVAETLELMINSYTDMEHLMNFAATWGIQDSPVVQFRLFQLSHPEYDDDTVNEHLDGILESMGGPLETPVTYNEEDFELTLAYVNEQEEIEGAGKALLFDDEMVETEGLCMEDGDWNPPSPVIQTGRGDEPQPGPSHRLEYTIRKKSKRTYAKNAAVDTTYQVKVDERYHGQQLQDVREGLYDLFQEALNQARGDLAGNDLGRVVIHHDGLHNPIVVPLQAWDGLNATKVMETIEKVLNSNETLSLDNSFDIAIGTVDLPKGSGGPRRRITRIRGDKNSLDLKKSIVTIDNDDHLCMARAIAVSWVKLHRCTADEWAPIAQQRNGKSNLQLVLEHRKVPDSYYRDLIRKHLKQQGQLAATLCQMAGVPLDRPASLNDVEVFEEVLGVRVMVVSAKLGNKFVTGPSTDQRPCIYVYLVDNDHFHAITSITGFFSAGYFCETCLTHYNKKERHECEEKCTSCKRGHCPQTDQTLKCLDCNMTCRSQECYDQQKTVPLLKKGKKKGQPSGPSQCNKWWKCPTCYKVVRTDKRKKGDHACGEWYCSTCEVYVMDDHKCYLRACEIGQATRSVRVKRIEKGLVPPLF